VSTNSTSKCSASKTSCGAPGKYLHENHVGFDVGRLLNPILPRAYFDLRYSYTFVPKLDGFNIDRNNVDLEVGYFWKPSIAFRGIGSVQKTMGGLESLVSPDNPYFYDHDRLERGHYSRIGGGITFTLTRKLDLYVLVISTLSGKNIQAFTAPAIGISWNFRTRKSQESGTQHATNDQSLAASKVQCLYRQSLDRHRLAPERLSPVLGLEDPTR
jgi:hypothetical protein